MAIKDVCKSIFSNVGATRSEVSEQSFLINRVTPFVGGRLEDLSAQLAQVHDAVRNVSTELNTKFTSVHRTSHLPLDQLPRLDLFPAQSELGHNAASHDPESRVELQSASTGSIATNLQPIHDGAAPTPTTETGPASLDQLDDLLHAASQLHR